MLEEKVELLTKEIVALRKAIEDGGVAGAADAGEKAPAKKAAAKKAPAKKKAAPKHDSDEVGAIMRKAAKEVDKAAIQKYIGDQDCADLAELLTKPELFDPAYEYAEGLLEAEEEEVEEEEEDI